LARGAHKVSQHSYVGAISPDTSGVYGQAEPLGEIEIDTGIIQLRQAETLRRQNAVYARRIHRPGRTVTLPRPARQFVILLPIAFVPRGHRALYYVLCFRLDALCGQKVRLEFLSHRSTHVQPYRSLIRPCEAKHQALKILHIQRRASFSSPIVSNTLPGDMFREQRGGL